MNVLKLLTKELSILLGLLVIAGILLEIESLSSGIINLKFIYDYLDTTNFNIFWVILLWLIYFTYLTRQIISGFELMLPNMILLIACTFLITLISYHIWHLGVGRVMYPPFNFTPENSKVIEDLISERQNVLSIVRVFIILTMIITGILSIKKFKSQ
ncbi:MAG: hypothetical protein CMO01_11810 [Thalassobius sp.]|nr:hypothetical protein [Thalassovita sp.]